MSKKYRSILGFFVGFLLSVGAFFLCAGGHGTFAPMAANAPMLFFVPGLGEVWSFFGTPFLWAIYYAQIPQIASHWKRVTTVVSISVLHLLSGVGYAYGERQMFSEETQLARVFNLDSAAVISYGLLLISAFICLAFLNSEERNSRKQI